MGQTLGMINPSELVVIICPQLLFHIHRPEELLQHASLSAEESRRRTTTRFCSTFNASFDRPELFRARAVLPTRVARGVLRSKDIREEIQAILRRLIQREHLNRQRRFLA